MKSYNLPKKEWPKWLKHPLVKGIRIGSCITQDPFDWSESKAYAHAHSYPNEWCTGWLCFERKFLLTLKYVCLHELAHLISDNEEYSEEQHPISYIKTLVKIGGTLKEMKMQPDVSKW